MLQLLQQQIAQQNQRINTPSQWETQLGNEANSITGFLNSGDYRNLPSNLGAYVDLMPLSQAQQLRKLTRGSMNTGQGMINPQILASQRELDDNQFAQDWGNAYEQQIGNLGAQRNNLLGALQGMNDTRIGQNQQNMGNYTSYLQALSNRPKGFWSSFLPGLMQSGIGVGLSMI